MALDGGGGDVNLMVVARLGFLGWCSLDGGGGDMNLVVVARLGFLGGKDGTAVPEVNADDSHNWSSELSELPALEEIVEVSVFSHLLPPNETSIRKRITLVLDLDGHDQDSD
ncbi:hypothetical protein EZV62_025134 [Acer yangbiense]|uniref:Uncharacterized protein n=1 Tax=Acer yangbiense TaxID=1000413 RepID=A0A5C7GXK5_9ROSI|nr:hypothetical protein EZV62_025134 [Acer yangbiense]